MSVKGTCVAGDALAHIVIHLIEAGAIVSTGPGCTLVDVYFTVVSLEPRHTETAILIDPVSADGSVLAGVGGALINVVSAVGPGEARLADAGIVPRTLHTCPVI